MDLNTIKSVYFIGVGGIGMSAIAHYFLKRGVTVYGYDHVSSAVTDTLTKAGAILHFNDAITNYPEHTDLVIYTPAINRNFHEFHYFESLNIPILKRSQVLGMICNLYPTIAVAGTHGKTTTTSIVAHILHHQSPFLAFIGGIAKNFNSNFFIDENPQTAVVEADEFDRSFLSLFPKVAIITSIDADHLDIYGDKKHLIQSFQLFANQIDKDGTLLIHEKVFSLIQHPHKLSYGISNTATYRASNIRLFDNYAIFDIFMYGQKVVTDVKLGVSGMHNVLNALAAFAAVCQRMKYCLPSEFNPEIAPLAAKLTDFCGVKRRFDVRVARENYTYIDDYAHHPEEIKTFLTAIKSIYPNQKIVGIFQPHLYSRTRDFAQEFAQALTMLDKLILLDIYPAREEPIPGITSEYLLNLVPIQDKILLKKEELLPYIQHTKPQLLVTIGAGDIDRFVEPLEKLSF